MFNQYNYLVILKLITLLTPLWVLLIISQQKWKIINKIKM